MLDNASQDDTNEENIVTREKYTHRILRQHIVIAWRPVDLKQLAKTQSIYLKNSTNYRPVKIHYR